MSEHATTDSGVVVSLWRYPVKSMIGQELNEARLSERGVLGDRAYALMDVSDGKIATAKNPRKWPNLFAFSAGILDRREADLHAATVRITLPDGSVVTGTDPNANQALSKAVLRNVSLVATETTGMSAAQAAGEPGASVKAEEYWPDIDGLDHRDTVTDFELPTGTFFDCATVHLLTTTTLDSLQRAHPRGRFDVRRFRPNIVVDLPGSQAAFPENDWIGHTVRIGDQVRLYITGPAGRCVMTTLAQGNLPNDSGILRTAVQQNRANVGVYATVVHGGTIRHGDRVRLQER